jgi:hypothetical protein
MSDLELYIYIALALIYFLTRVFKPKKNPRPPGNYKDSAADTSETPARPSRERQMTFEELLQEFTGYREPPQTAAPDFEEEVKEEKIPEEIQEEKEEYQYYEGYDDYKKSSFTGYNSIPQEERKMVTIDEQVSLDEPLLRKFEWGVDELSESSYTTKYRNMLKNRESIRDAIILKEILDRKYF